MPRKVLTEETLQEIIRRVVEVAQLERIVRKEIAKCE
jgi:hypothetical protein